MDVDKVVHPRTRGVSFAPLSDDRHRRKRSNRKKHREEPGSVAYCLACIEAKRKKPGRVAGIVKWPSYGPRRPSTPGLLLHVLDVQSGRVTMPALRSHLEAHLEPGQTVEHGRHYWLLLTDLVSMTIPTDRLPDQSHAWTPGPPATRVPGKLPVFCDRCKVTRWVTEASALRVGRSYLSRDPLVL